MNEMFQEDAKIDNRNCSSDSIYLKRIEDLDKTLKKKYSSIMRVDTYLSRQIVSFQANKKIPFYRWFKYKEGFSAELVINYINKHGIKKTKSILDPFAGSGATLFVASDLGINSVGIELLPIGKELIKSRNILLNDFSEKDFERLVYWINEKPWLNYEGKKVFNCSIRYF